MKTILTFQPLHSYAYNSELTQLNIPSSKWLAFQTHTHSRPSCQNPPFEHPFRVDISTLWSPTSIVNSQFSLWSSLFFLLTSSHCFQVETFAWGPLSPHSSPYPTHLASSWPHPSALPFPAEPLYLGEAATSLPDTDFLLGPCSATSAVHNCTHYIPKSMCELL